VAFDTFDSRTIIVKVQDHALSSSIIVCGARNYSIDSSLDVIQQRLFLSYNEITSHDIVVRSWLWLTS
jgi:hypothetical protein